MPVTQLPARRPGGGVSPSAQQPESRAARRAPALVLCALAAVCAGCAVWAPGAFFGVFSLWAGAALFCGVLAAVRRAGVRLGLYHWTVLGGVYLTLAICTCLVVEGRQFVYIWDYANYLLLQYQAEAAFAAGPLAGFGYLFSTLTEDYTSFICLFAEFPFCLTDHTGDSYAVCGLVSVLPSLLAALAGVTVKAGQVLGVDNEQGFYLIGLSAAACFPFLRMAAVLGQPDWLGLVFALVIVVLTLDYRFDAPDLPRCLGVFAAAAALALTRRWYLYFIVGYFLIYSVTVLGGTVRLALQGDGRRAADRLRGFITFAAGSLAAVLVLFRPIVARILAYGYAEHYAVYNTGGLGLEVYNQLFRLGVYLPLMAWGLARFVRRGGGGRGLALGALCTLAVSLALFTRVQNMGSHQTLLLLPGYFLLMLCGAAALADTLGRLRPLKLGYWLFILAFSLPARMSPLTIVPLPEPLYPLLADLPALTEFIRLDNMTRDRTDLDGIRAVADWVDAHCAGGETAYLIPHSMTYCPDTFKNVGLPAQPLADKLDFGFGILGTQPFPTGLFDAKYVLTADPFPWCYEVSNMAAKLNDLFFTISGPYFEPAASFDMGNGTVFTAYRRVVPATRAEAEAYLAAFAAEDAQFPELYGDVIDGWLAAHGL